VTLRGSEAKGILEIHFMQRGDLEAFAELLERAREIA
jgi:hypothetical protein